MVGFWSRPSSWLTDGHLLPGSQYSGEGGLVPSSSKHQSHPEDSTLLPSSKPYHLPRPYLQTPSHCHFNILILGTQTGTPCQSWPVGCRLVGGVKVGSWGWWEYVRVGSQSVGTWISRPHWQVSEVVSVVDHGAGNIIQ